MIFNPIIAQQKDFYAAASIKIIERNRCCFWDNSTLIPGPVTTLDPFQSFEDLQNDVAACLIKPVACIFLYWYNVYAVMLNLYYACVHLITLNPTAACACLEKAIIAFVAIFYYFFEFFRELIAGPLSLATRTIITVAEGICYAGKGIGDFFVPESGDNSDTQSVHSNLSSHV